MERSRNSNFQFSKIKGFKESWPAILDIILLSANQTFKKDLWSFSNHNWILLNLKLVVDTLKTSRDTRRIAWKEGMPIIDELQPKSMEVILNVCGLKSHCGSMKCPTVLIVILPLLPTQLPSSRPYIFFTALHNCRFLRFEQSELVLDSSIRKEDPFGSALFNWHFEQLRIGSDFLENIFNLERTINSVNFGVLTYFVDIKASVAYSTISAAPWFPASTCERRLFSLAK